MFNKASPFLPQHLQYLGVIHTYSTAWSQKLDSCMHSYTNISISYTQARLFTIYYCTIPDVILSIFNEVHWLPVATFLYDTSTLESLIPILHVLAAAGVSATRLRKWKLRRRASDTVLRVRARFPRQFLVSTFVDEYCTP